MYEIKQRYRDIFEGDRDWDTITTYTREVMDCNMLEVEAGTNGYKGGDSGHGSRTYFRIKDIGGTDIEAKIIRASEDTNGGIEVSLGGDAELRTILKALKFIVNVLEYQTLEIDNENDNWNNTDFPF